MGRPMRSSIVRIGNSQGVRIPKLLLQEAEISGPVELRAEKGRIVVERAEDPRAGWQEAAERIAAEGGDELSMGNFPNEFDNEWTLGGLEPEIAQMVSDRLVEMFRM